MLRKNIEKSAKIEVFGLPKPSQNPPKTAPKTCSQKTCKFSWFFARFFYFAAMADSGSDPLGMVFCAHQTIFFKLLFACIFGPKNLPKTLPKQRPNPLKIDAQNVLFFNIDFFTSWPRFWSLLGFQDGAKLAKMAPRPRGLPLPRAFLS